MKSQTALGLFFTFCLLAQPAAAECIDAPDLAEYQIPDVTESATGLTPAMAGPTRDDRLGRVVAPVTINGEGPYRFIVDTGANRSAISRRLAERLALTPAGNGDVHSIYGVSSSPFVTVGSLRYSTLSLGGRAMPTLDDDVLAGEHGLLGVDGMGGQRLRLDFERNCIEIIRSNGAPRLRSWSTVAGELRFGHLVLMRGTVHGQPVSMFIDTGSNQTLANPALRDALRDRMGLRSRRVDPVRAYTAGEPVVLDTIMILQDVELGTIEARDLVAYVGDFHIFRLWGLTEEPALLIGMDVLSQTRGVAIDYERATVHFRLRSQARSGSRLMGRGSSSQTSIRQDRAPRPIRSQPQ